MKFIKHIFYLIVIIVVALLAIGFSVQNSHSTILHYYFGSLELPLSTLMVLSFASGVLLALSGGSFIVLRLRLKFNQCKKHHQKLEIKYSKKLKQADNNTTLKVVE